MSLPVGTIVGMIGIDLKQPPTGWLYCDGSTFEGLKYPDLAKVLPNNVLPNLIGLALIGASDGGKTPPSSLGNTSADGQNTDGTYGSGTHSLSVDELAQHCHWGFGDKDTTWSYGTVGTADNWGSAGGVDKDNFYYNTSDTGKGQAFSLMQPSYALYFMICALSDTV